MTADKKNVTSRAPKLIKQAQAYIAAASHLSNLSRDVHSLVDSEFGLVPAAVEEFHERVTALLDWSNGCHQRSKVGNPLLEGADARMVRVALLGWRRKRATELDRPRSKTTDLGIIERYDAEIECIHWLLNQPDLEVKPARLPRLTDYMSVQRAEAVSISNISLGEREYDQKFEILLSARLVDVDLEFYRAKCGLRGLPLTLAFIDIDNFKSYNTDFGHPTVDRELLPQLQQVIESHAFHRGETYKEGGDEFITILPNMSEDQARAHLTDLQRRLSKVEYRLKLKNKPTISAGLTTVLPDSFMTTREIRESANSALLEAKAQGGNRVVIGADLANLLF